MEVRVSNCVQFFHNEVLLFRLGQWNEEKEPFGKRPLGFHTAYPVLPCLSAAGLLLCGVLL